MQFNKGTKITLERILSDLESELLTYEWGTDEYNILLDLMAEIDDLIREIR